MKARRGRPKGRRGKKGREIPWGRWALYTFGRVLQVTGLLITLLAATAYFGTPSTTAMLRMMLVGVLFFLPGWFLSRRDPNA